MRPLPFGFLHMPHKWRLLLITITSSSAIERTYPSFKLDGISILRFSNYIHKVQLLLQGPTKYLAALLLCFIFLFPHYRHLLLRIVTIQYQENTYQIWKDWKTSIFKLKESENKLARAINSWEHGSGKEQHIVCHGLYSRLSAGCLLQNF